MSIDEVKANLEGFEDRLDMQVKNAVQRTAESIVNNAVNAIKDPSSGEKVRRYNPKRDHTVSKKGDAPNTDTGRLIGSIKALHQKTESYVYSDAGYGFYLETVLDRPFLEPAVKAEMNNFKKRIEFAIKAAIK